MWYYEFVKQTEFLGKQTFDDFSFDILYKNGDVSHEIVRYQPTHQICFTDQL